MADDSKEKPSADPEGNLESGDDKAVPFVPSNKAVPFVPYDDSANMAAIFAAQRRRIVPDAGGLALSGETPIVLLGTAALKADAIVLQVNWAAEVIRRLEAMEAGLQRLADIPLEALATAYREQPGIGHNNPPEDIGLQVRDLRDDLHLGIVTAQLMRAEVSAANPRFDVIRVCGLVFNRLTKRVSACVQWLGARSAIFLDAFLKSAGAEAGKRVVQGVTVAAVLALMEDVHGDLSGVVTEIHRVFELLHLPFF